MAGASGYAGGELLRLIAGHPALEVGPVCAAASAGRRLGEVHPQLPELADRALAPTDPDALADSDIVFVALPHGESAPLVARLPAAVPVVDLGADFRLGDAADWRRHYGGPHATPHAGQWPYGLPELFRHDLRGATRVAGPGCYPTAVALALAPLLSAGLVAAEDLVVVAASGTSGAGRGARTGLLGSEVMGDLTAYKVAAHQHAPEIRQTLARVAAPAGGARDLTLSFTTVLAPMPRGILATCTARTSATEEELRAALTAQYAGEPFVHVLPAGSWPHTAATVGGNACHLQVAVDADAGRAVVVSALDNLGKGAAGQAVQCANLVLGLAETAGLTSSGVAP